MTTPTDFVGRYTVQTASHNFHGNEYEGPMAKIGDTLEVRMAQGSPTKIELIFNDDADHVYAYDWDPATMTCRCHVQDLPFRDPSGNLQTTYGTSQLSLFSGENGYKTIYSCFVAGDPEQTGVWGADSDGG